MEMVRPINDDVPAANLRFDFGDDDKASLVNEIAQAMLAYRKADESYKKAMNRVHKAARERLKKYQKMRELQLMYDMQRREMNSLTS